MDNLPKHINIYKSQHPLIPHNTHFLCINRGLLEHFQAKCWSPEEAQCIDSDLPRDECFTRMDPELILGADSECKRAFVATLGTVLHHPCTCKRLYNDDLLTCSMIHEVLHNRSRFSEYLFFLSRHF